MKNNPAELADALRRIQTEGGGDNFVIFETENYYIQFAGSPDTPHLYGEAVGNEYLDPALQLSAGQIARLELAGWQPSPYSGNYAREWETSTDQERLIVARETVHLFDEVYGVAPDAPLEMKLSLE